MEHISVLMLYLHSIYPRAKLTLEDGLLNRRVIRLARQWKSLLALDRISRGVFLIALGGFIHAPLTSLFITAVGLEDSTLLGFIVSQTGRQPRSIAWSETIDNRCSPRGSKSMCGSSYSPSTYYRFGCWPLEEYLSIPPHIVYAMACLIAKSNDYPAIGKDLKDRLDQTCE